MALPNRSVVVMELAGLKHMKRPTDSKRFYKRSANRADRRTERQQVIEQLTHFVQMIQADREELVSDLALMEELENHHAKASKAGPLPDVDFDEGDVFGSYYYDETRSGNYGWYTDTSELDDSLDLTDFSDSEYF